MNVLMGIGQSTWQDYVFGTFMVVAAVVFVLAVILLGIQRVREFFAQFKPPTSVDETLAEMAKAANAAKAEKRARHG